MTLAASLTLFLTVLPQDAPASPAAPTDAAHAQNDAQDPAPIAWQRTLADALAVQKRTGLPLLIAVNSRGEVFNDRFRNRTYKSREFIELTRGYVCVIASPDRYTAADYDSFGNRIESPEFPGCTDGEHIAIEPELFRRYFNGNRTAPRHIGVSPDGKILFDRFLDRSMQTAIDAIAENRGTPDDAALPTTVEGLLQRRDAAARRLLEAMYRESRDPAILQAAGNADTEPFDLLRLALHSGNESEFERGCDALAKTATAAALPDLENALARSPDSKALRAALERVAADDERAARFLAHLRPDPSTLSPPWAGQWREPSYEIWQRPAIESELDACEAAVRERPEDAAARLRLAIAQLAFSKHLIATGGTGVEFWLEDARTTAGHVQAAELAPAANAVIAVASWLRSDNERAREATAQALAARGGETPDAWLATRLLEVAIQLDTQAAYARAIDPKVILQPEVARVRAMLDRVEQGRWIESPPLLTGIGLLEYVGDRATARRLLDAAVRRFPAENTVHERWRARTLADLGADAMRQRAGALVDAAADKATALWFAGYAAIVAAEQHVRDERHEPATAAYTDSIARFLASVEQRPDYQDSGHHFAVLALAGRAALRAAADDNEQAVADLQRASELRSQSFENKDGLGRSPRQIANDLRDALETAGQTDLAAAIPRH